MELAQQPSTPAIPVWPALREVSTKCSRRKRRAKKLRKSPRKCKSLFSWHCWARDTSYILHWSVPFAFTQWRMDPAWIFSGALDHLVFNVSSNGVSSTTSFGKSFLLLLGPERKKLYMVRWLRCWFLVFFYLTLSNPFTSINSALSLKYWMCYNLASSKYANFYPI